MAESVAEILLKITGDASSARDELLTVSKQIQQFDGEDAEATLDVDAEPAEKKLKDVFGDLARLAKEKVTATVDADATEARREITSLADERVTAEVAVEADTKQAQTAIQRLAARLSAIRDETVEIDVDTEQGERALQRLGDFADRGRGGFNRLAQGIRDTGTVLIGVLIPGVISLMGTLAPLAATLASAGLGVAALGAGLVGVLVPAMLLATGLMAGFEEQSEKAGTAAFKLKKEFTAFQKAFREALSPATAQLIAGIRVLLDAALGTVRALSNEMTRFGGAVRGALGLFAGQLERATPMLERMTRLGAGAVRPLARIFANLGRILLNISVAALPFLVDGLKLVADETRKWVRTTSDIERMRGFIRGFMRDLQDVAEFAREAGRLILAIFNAFRGPGRSAANDLTELVKQTADWAESAKGQREIRAFFASAFFAIKDLGEFIRTYGPAIGAFFVTFGKLTTALMQVFNRVGPGVTQVIGALAGFAVFGKALASVFSGLVLPVLRAAAGAFQFVAQKVVFAEGIFGRILGVLGRFAGPVGAVVSTFLILEQVMGKVRAALTILSPAISGFIFVIQGWAKAIGAVLPALKELGGAVIDGVKAAFDGAVAVARQVVTGIIGAFRARISAAFDVGRAVMNAVKDGLQAVTGAIRQLANTIARAVVAIVRSYVDNARAAGTAVFQAVRNGIASVAEAIRGAASSILSRVIEIVRSFVDNARNAGTAVFNAVRGGIADAAEAVREAARSIISRAIEIVRSFVDNARSAGESIINNVANGFIHAAGEAISAARNVVNRALDAVGDLASAFFAAGQAVMGAFARGLTSAAGSVLDAAGNVLGSIKDKLPGSEPKDHSSPLYRIGEAGQAFVSNLAAGIAKSGPLLSEVVSSALAGMSASVAAQVQVGAAAPVVNIPALAQPIRQAGDTYNLPISTSGYGPQSDATEALSMLATMIRGRGGLG